MKNASAKAAAGNSGRDLDRDNGGADISVSRSIEHQELVVAQRRPGLGKDHIRREALRATNEAVLSTASGSRLQRVHAEKGHGHTQTEGLRETATRTTDNRYPRVCSEQRT